jgi:hypothetical protein
MPINQPTHLGKIVPGHFALPRRYVDLPSGTLLELRQALLADIRSGGDAAFCRARIAAIEAEIIRRQEATAE